MRGWWSPGTSTGMTAVKSLSFAQHKSEQNKIAIAKAGYHRGDGILPFVLYGAFGGNRCVRTYAGKWQNSTISGVFFHGGVWYTRLSSTNRNLYIKENIDEIVFMFALFKCRKSDKGRN